MTSDIGHINAMFNAAHLPAERLPARDFAQELAKEGDGKIVHHMPQQVGSGAAHGMQVQVGPGAAGGASAQVTGPGVSGNAPVQARPGAAGGAPAQAISPGVSSGAPVQAGPRPAPSAHPAPGVPEPRMAGVSPATKLPSTELTGFSVSAAVHEQLGVVVQPTGNTEALLGSRVFGVHLLASTYLSELTARAYPDPAVAPEVTLQGGTHMPAQMRGLPSEMPSLAKDAVADTDLLEVVREALNAMVKSGAPAGTSGSSPPSATAIGSMAASTMLWPESLLRLTRQRDGDAVIWLRDYRASPEAASQLVTVLVEGAKAEGIRLGRIVLNGREVWTSRNKHC
ncbi:MAG: hypothetical protein KGJ63_01760 [Pseudomonadota bacterium]|nr:hypothetical protein [Pseudomonadota bacterium]